MKGPPATRERSLSRVQNIFAEKARVTPSEMDAVAETHTHTGGHTKSGTEQPNQILSLLNSLFNLIRRPYRHLQKCPLPLPPSVAGPVPSLTEWSTEADTAGIFFFFFLRRETEEGIQSRQNKAGRMCCSWAWRRCSSPSLWPFEAVVGKYSLTETRPL